MSLNCYVSMGNQKLGLETLLPKTASVSMPKEFVSLSAHELQAPIERQTNFAAHLGGRNELKSATQDTDCNGRVCHYSSALLLLAIGSLLIACGGGGGGGERQAAVVCSTGGPVPAALTWDAVTGATGYRIYYGTVPGSYLQSRGQGLDVGNVTTYALTGLNSGMTYYFAATAYGSSIPPNEGGFSNEVCKTIQ
jgi:hypothetical protein